MNPLCEWSSCAPPAGCANLSKIKSNTGEGLEFVASQVIAAKECGANLGHPAPGGIRLHF